MLRKTILLLAFTLMSWGSAAKEAPTETINGRFLLMDHFGETVTDAQFNGRFRLIAFGYTHCPDVCPTSLGVMTTVMDNLGADAARVQPLFITVDPERDNAGVMRNYVNFFHSSIIGLTGSKAMIERTAQNFKVRYERVVNEGDDPKQYWMDHTASLYLMAPDGRFLTKFAYGISPKAILEKMRRYL
jgi:protein SCO1/2